MTGKRSASAPISPRPQPHATATRIRSNLALLDAREPSPEDFEEIPELDDAWFEGAEYRVGDRLVRRGRPPSPSPKQQVTIRLDADVLAGLRATGPGWQGRANAALKDWLARHGAIVGAPR